MAYLSVKELAIYFGVTERTIYRLLGCGQLRGFKVGWQWRVDEKELERFKTEGEGGIT